MQSDIAHLNRRWMQLVQNEDSSIAARDCRFFQNLPPDKMSDAFESGFALFMPSSFRVMASCDFYAWAEAHQLEHTYLLMLKYAAEASIARAALHFGVERLDLREILLNPHIVPVSPWTLRYPASVFEQASPVFKSLKVKMAIFRRAGVMQKNKAGFAL